MEGPTAEMPPLAMAGGGIANLRSQADMVRRANRSGDSVLAHINPREAEMLGRTQGSSINPITGLPEYGFFDSIGKFFKKAAARLWAASKAVFQLVCKGCLAERGRA
jgi:hypothetical protein